MKPGMTSVSNPTLQVSPDHKYLELMNKKRLQTIRAASPRCDVIPTSIAQEVVGRATKNAAQMGAIFGENKSTHFQIPTAVRMA